MMQMLWLLTGALALLAANVLLFVSVVSLRPLSAAEYVGQLAAAVLLVPMLVLLAMLPWRRLRTPRRLLAGGLAGLAGSLALSAASIALAPPARLETWNAAEKQAHLDQRCRRQCRNRGTRPELCDTLCACTMEAVFTSRSQEELQRLTVEGPYGRLSREANLLMGEMGARCAEKQRDAVAAGAPPD